MSGALKDAHQHVIERAWARYLSGENFVMAFRIEWRSK